MPHFEIIDIDFQATEVLLRHKGENIVADMWDEYFEQAEREQWKPGGTLEAVLRYAPSRHTGMPVLVFMGNVKYSEE